MPENLNLTIIQSDLYWESIGANLAMFEEKIWKIGSQTDLIILPEMFSTGFSMNAANLAEPMNSQTTRWMKQQASQTGAVVTGSFIVKENTNFYNRLIWMQPDGSYAFYDKRHLFRMAEEHLTFSSGNKKLIVDLKGWKVCPMICYDLRFPVWSRNVSGKNSELSYDVLLYIANWPKARISAWDTLLKARAIENLAYVVGVNRTGSDEKGIDYNGHSAVINAKGAHISLLEEDQTIMSVELDYSDLIDFRKKFPAYNDADDFQINL